MLHAVYFKKDPNGSWIVSYKNRYVETETFKLEKQMNNKPCFLPVLEGDASAVLAAQLLNAVVISIITICLVENHIHITLYLLLKKKMFSYEIVFCHIVVFVRQ